MHQQLQPVFQQAEDANLSATQLVARVYFSDRVEHFFDRGTPCSTFMPVLFGVEKFSCLYLIRYVLALFDNIPG